MKKILCLLVSCVILWSCHHAEQPFKMIEPVDFSHVTITDSFWTPRLKNHTANTLAVCIDQIENQTGRMQNFENAAKGEGVHSGIYFDDSDVYKALEGIAYSLMNHPDPELERKADEWIDKIAAAQQPDGYINTYYTLTGLDKRWSNMHMHEMYCAGHMMEAAVAYFQATGKRKLLDVSIRMANHLMDIFGPGKRHWVPGHEEIELALVKLYNVTDDQRFLDFSSWLLEERGHGHGSWGKRDARYCQDDIPLRDLTGIGGHAVRAMYLFCGMADVAALKRDSGYIEALDRVWDHVVLRNMYVTGGIGSSRHNEGFTEDYDLPNYDAYCETCASVGMVYWNSRMIMFTGDSKYGDVVERSMYNGALAGISLVGDRFFYVNPLASKGGHHRQEWYGCACCPSQVSRFLPSIGNYIYGVSGGAIWVNLYMGNTAEFPVGKEKITLRQETNYPWEGSVNIVIEHLSSVLKKDIRLRIPEWCKNYSIAVNGAKMDTPKLEKGYAVVNRKWKSGDRITIHFDMPVEVIASDPQVKENTGKRAIQRGPLVYCIEQTDNPNDFEKQVLSWDMKYTNTFRPILNGVMCIQATDGTRTLNLVPYYAWDNREAGEMKVWIDYENKKLDFLFVSGDDGYNTFRIPAMTVTNNGTLLAFAEGRKNSSSDTGDIDLVLKRSTDGGKSWSPLQVIWDDGENVCGNPAPVVDRETGTIFLLMTWNLGADREPQIIDLTSKDTRRVFITHSTDDGITWSTPVEITKDVKRDDWTWYATGPCQGIQLVHGPCKGRMVVPCDHIEAGSKKYFSHAIYSDDHGKTWQLGGNSPVDQVNECTVAESSDGTLLLNMRNYDRTQKNRKTAISRDGGATWTDFKSDVVLVEPICQAAMHRYSFSQEGTGRLLFSNPANTDKRCNMTLRLSYDDGVTWAKSMVLYPGPAAYSEIVRLPDGDIGCFYEAGYERPYEGIVFEKIKLSDLEK